MGDPRCPCSYYLPISSSVDLSFNLSSTPPVPHLHGAPPVVLRPIPMSPLVRRPPARRIQARHDCTLAFSFVITSAGGLSGTDSQYSYLGAVPLLMVYGIGMTVIKVKEGASYIFLMPLSGCSAEAVIAGYIELPDGTCEYIMHTSLAAAWLTSLP